MHDVFISYSSRNQTIADAVVNILENQKIKCWIAYRDAETGNDYAVSIIKAIKNCKVCVLILSQESNDSKHVLNEINSCVNYGISILPLKIADVMLHEAIEYYLGKTHWLDAITPPLEVHIYKLADRIKSLLDNGNSEEAISSIAQKPAEPVAIKSNKFSTNEKKPADETKQETTKGNLKIIIIISAAVIVLGIGIFLFFRLKDTNKQAINNSQPQNIEKVEPQLQKLEPQPAEPEPQPAEPKPQIVEPGNQLPPVSINVIPAMPDSNSSKIYQLQVGSYPDGEDEVNRVIENLRRAGFSPVTERATLSIGVFNRVLIPNVSAPNVYNTIQRLEAAGIPEVLIRD